MLRRAQRPDPGRSRRVLAVAAAAVVAAELLAGIALDAAPPAVRFAEGARVLRRARRLAGTPYVLLLGSSRFWAIDVETAAATLRDTVGSAAPPLLQGAVLGGDAIVADYLLARLIAEGSPPALIALEISPETVGHPSHWVAGDAIRFFAWRDVVAWAPEIALRGRPAEVLAARLAPIDVYRRELLTWIVGHPPPYLWVASPAAAHDSGSTADSARAIREPARGPRSAAGAEPRRGPNAATLSGLRQTRGWLRHYRLGGETSALERVLARSRAAGIRVVLVGVPVSSWVRELYTPTVEGTFRGYMERLRERDGTEFVDYRARMPDRLFSDHHHLNPPGGTLFARLLATEVLAPRLHASTRASRDAPDAVTAR